MGTKATDIALNVAVAVAKSGFSKVGEGNNENMPQRFELEDISGFEPISLADATELKTICWGSAALPPKNFWVKQGFVFHPPEKLFAYGVKPPMNGTKNLFMAVQPYFLKHLFFETDPKDTKAKPTAAAARRQSRFSKSGREDMNDKNQRKGSVKTNQILRPNASDQLNMIIGGISEAIFKAAQGGEAIFCMMSMEANFEPNIHFGIDGFTERIVLTRCKSFEALKGVVKKYIYHMLMETGSGLLCFLYSLIMSRNFERLRKDLQNEIVSPLIDMRGDCHPALLNLVLFGEATPYYHNGPMMIKDDSGETHERIGINDRSDIGLLVWSHEDEATAALNVGSRLKTPVLPLWVTLCNDVVGVLFNPNKDLMRSHDAEKRFSLYYYSNFEFKEGTAKETKLTVETNPAKGVVMREFDDDDNDEVPPLELLIKTKWEDCAINWNGVHPYI